MNDSLFPTNSESDRDGLRTIRGRAACVVAGTAFWIAIVGGALIGAVIA